MTDPTMTKTVALLPCPFCGIRPERLKNLDFSDSEAFWHPDDSTDCILNGCSIHRDKWEGWNRRATRTQTDQQLREEVERLISAVVELKRAWWDVERHRWNLADFKNFAAVQQADDALAHARAAINAGEPK